MRGTICSFASFHAADSAFFALHKAMAKMIWQADDKGRPAGRVELLQAVCAVTHRKEKMHVYEAQPRSDKHGVDLISDVLPFGRLWYGEPSAIANAISYAKFFSRSHRAVIRAYDAAGNVIETHQHKGDFSKVLNLLLDSLRAHIRL
jgi:hypothetical protein